VDGEHGKLPFAKWEELDKDFLNRDGSNGVGVMPKRLVWRRTYSEEREHALRRWPASLRM
jgi:hypothetical protein